MLFENLREKRNIFEENIQKLRIQNKHISQTRLSYNNLNILKKENKRKSQKLNIDFQYMKKKLHIHNCSSALNNKELLIKNSDCNSSVNMSNIPQIDSKKANSKFYQQHKRSIINTINQFLITNDNFKSELKFPKFIDNNNINKKNHHKKEFIKEKLFPYKYYLCSVFIKNLDISHKQNFLSSRFSKIYIFLCQLIDITTYLSLQREFNALKSIFNDKSLNIIEKNKKININSNSFIKVISDCIGKQKFHILAQGNK